MFEYFVDPEAVGDLMAAERAYLEYFSRFGEYEKGVRWAERFFEDYRQEIENLKRDPCKHPVCCVFPFDCCDTAYRSFVVGWFTVFYTVEEASFVVWAVKGSKSDFSRVRFRDG